MTVEPLVGVRIFIDGVSRGRTDATGRLVLQVPRGSSWLLSAKHPDYESELERGAGGGDLELLMIPTSLGETIIIESDDTSAPATATVLREQVRVVPGARGDAVSVIKSLPGVANNGQLTPQSAGLIIRGSSPKDSRILIDGFEIPLLYHFLGVQSVLPSEMIEDVELQPGGFGVEYGRASGGIVNVTSRMAERQWRAAGEVSFVNASAFAQGPVSESGAFAISVRRSLIDAILPAAIPDDANLNFTALPRYYDYQGRFDWAANDKVRLSLFVLGSDDAVNLLNDNDNPTDPAASGSFVNNTRFTRAIASVLYEGSSVESRNSVSAFTVDDRFKIGRRQSAVSKSARSRCPLEHRGSPRAWALSSA